jgi:PHD/YefM family antitoxin component YafN of YafNO toxin-antitoxin module
MIAINVTEFRGNMKKYLAISENEKVIVHSAKGKAYAIVPIEEVEEDSFTAESILSDEQIKAIDKGLQDIRNGNVKSHEEVLIERKKRFPHLF